MADEEKTEETTETETPVEETPVADEAGATAATRSPKATWSLTLSLSGDAGA